MRDSQRRLAILRATICEQFSTRPRQWTIALNARSENIGERIQPRQRLIVGHTGTCPARRTRQKRGRSASDIGKIRETAKPNLKPTRIARRCPDILSSGVDELRQCEL